jgi:predicted protein tyrosine phosphatase
MVFWKMEMPMMAADAFLGYATSPKALDGSEPFSVGKGIRPRYAAVMTRKVLFLCSQNRLRSPTAEQVFAEWPGIETASAGLLADAEEILSPELLQWADLVFVMERAHRNRLSSRYKPWLKGKRVICLDIPDDYEYMDPVLVELLKRKVPPFLR